MRDNVIIVTEQEWHERLFELARHVAGWSKDPRRKVGAVLVTPDKRQFSFGYNGFPRGTPDRREWLMSTAMRRKLMVHGEANAVTNAQFPTAHCTLYVTKYPCHVCAGTIVNSGVSRLVAPAGNFDHETWGQSYRDAQTILSYAGVEVITVPAPRIPREDGED